MPEEAALQKPVLRPRVIGRYALFGEIAAGGMATVHFGRLVGPVGFSRTVAIKRLHPQYAKDPEFVAMFLDEARLASRIQHPNVVTTLDVVNMPNEVFLVMEYVQGESLSRLIRNARKGGGRVPPGHVAAIMAGMLHGLHAAHEAKSERREPLNIVHRDISPQNVLVGTDGAARVLDFGVAKAAMRSQSTRDGQMKGKLSYMSPEQLNGKAVDRRTDLFAAGVVLWEALTAKRLFDGADAGEIFAKLLAGEILEPKTVVDGIGDALNAVVMKSLERDPDLRYQTAREFAIDLESATQLATPRTVGEWVEQVAGEDLERRAQLVAEIESISTDPEHLAVLEDEFVETLEETAIERPSVSSAMQPASGSRPRMPPPGGASSTDREERSAASSPGASTSQVSNLIVPNLLAAPPRSRGSRGVILAALGACLGGGVLAFLVFTTSHPRPEVVPPPAQPVVAAAPPAPVPQPAVSARATPPTETVEVKDLPPAPPDDEAEGRRSGLARPAPHEVPARRSEPAHRVATKAATKAPASNCNPPFTIDGSGIKHIKPECL